MKNNEKNNTNGFFQQIITRDQDKDTGMAIVLICLIISLATGKLWPVKAATVVLLLNMTIPGVFRPAAIIWFAFSHVLGTIMSKVVLTLIFFIIVVPIGMARRFAGADPLQLKKWKKNRDSVFKTRNHKFKPGDLKVPY